MIQSQCYMRMSNTIGQYKVGVDDLHGLSKNVDFYWVMTLLTVNVGI